MGIFNRLTDIFRAEGNAALDKLEDPSKMVDQAVVDAKMDYAKIKQAVAGIQTQVAREKADVDKLTAKIQEVEKAAEAAVAAGSDDDALKLLQKKSVMEQELAREVAEYEDVNAQLTEHMQSLKDYQVQIDKLDQTRASIKSKSAIADAAEKANKARQKIDIDDPTSKLNRLQDKVNTRYETAKAHKDISAKLNEDPDADLLSKYAGGTTATDELQKMKEKLGK